MSAFKPSRRNCLIMLVSLLLPACASGETRADNSCAFRHSVQEIGSLREVPKPIVDDLVARIPAVGLQRFGIPEPPKIVDRTEDFNATDSGVLGLSSRRFIRAGHWGDKWFVWYEHGGIVYNKPIVLWEMGISDIHPRLITRVLVWENLCEQTDKLLDGNLPPTGDLEHDRNW